MPPARRHFLYLYAISNSVCILSGEAGLLVKKSGLIAINLLQNSPHQGLTNQPAPIRHPIPAAESLQRLVLTLIEQDRDPMFTRLFLHHRYIAILAPHVTMFRCMSLTNASPSITVSLSTFACWNCVNSTNPIAVFGFN